MQIEELIKIDTLTTGEKVYVTDYFLGSAVLILLLVLTILTIILLLVRRKKSKKEIFLVHEKKQLEENYSKLQETHQETISEKNTLGLKYEDLKISKDKIKKLAYMDHITELPNRLAFTEMIDSVMLTLRSSEVVALMNIDLDNFKYINDTLGHSYGDELLIDVAHRIKQAIDSNDYLARVGGDEFFILSQNIVDFGEYEAKLKKIQRIFDYPFVLSMKEYFITVSIGIAVAPKDGKTTQIIVKNADLAMYTAKENGRNTFCYFNDAINLKLMEKIQMQSELRQGIEKQEFLVYYQPQLNMTNNQIVGFEALLRWNHPEKGIITPNEFIPHAESTGLIVPMGSWILREACKQLKVWEEQGYTELIIAVNISVRQFKDKEFVSMVKHTIDETQINPSRLELEITETIALEDVEYTIAIMNELKELGVMFSLDDFGTGYSSMNYLKLLPVSNLKIDKSFLDNVVDNHCEQSIVQTIISLAKILDLVVIAEGVETQDQAIFLQNAKCDKAQGYLYSRPVTVESANRLLRG